MQPLDKQIQKLKSTPTEEEWRFFLNVIKEEKNASNCTYLKSIHWELMFF